MDNKKEKLSFAVINLAPQVAKGFAAYAADMVEDEQEHIQMLSLVGLITGNFNGMLTTFKNHVANAKDKHYLSFIKMDVVDYESFCKIAKSCLDTIKGMDSVKEHDCLPVKTVDDLWDFYLKVKYIIGSDLVSNDKAKDAMLTPVEDEVNALGKGMIESLTDSKEGLNVLREMADKSPHASLTPEELLAKTLEKVKGMSPAEKEDALAFVKRLATKLSAAYGGDNILDSERIKPLLEALGDKEVHTTNKGDDRLQQLINKLLD